MILPIPEVRKVVKAGKRYFAGKIHFSHVVCPIEGCDWGSVVYIAHPAIRHLAKDLQIWFHQVWNQYGRL